MSIKQDDEGFPIDFQEFLLACFIPMFHWSVIKTPMLRRFFSMSQTRLSISPISKRPDGKITNKIKKAFCNLFCHEAANLDCTGKACYIVLSSQKQQLCLYIFGKQSLTWIGQWFNDTNKWAGLGRELRVRIAFVFKSFKPVIWYFLFTNKNYDKVIFIYCCLAIIFQWQILVGSTQKGLLYERYLYSQYQKLISWNVCTGHFGTTCLSMQQKD